jgi:uncharacterized damage-inducible protein DinB
MAAQRGRSGRRGKVRRSAPARATWRGTAGGAPLPRALAPAIARIAVDLLRDTYLPRIERAVAELPARDVWWRPHARTTSVGNLLLHLQGNIRQWIVTGLGGAPDARDRDAEFAARQGAAAPELLAALRATVTQAAAVIEPLDERALLGRVTLQGFRLTRLEAVLHVVEHTSWHAGQIAWIAKSRAGKQHRIAYYDDRKLLRHNKR